MARSALSSGRWRFTRQCYPLLREGLLGWREPVQGLAIRPRRPRAQRLLDLRSAEFLQAARKAQSLAQEGRRPLYHKRSYPSRLALA
jgi:hypothetical protein